MGEKIIPIKQAIQQTSKKILLTRYNPSNCMAHAGKLVSVNDAINSPSHSLGKIQREQSKKFTEGLVLIWLMYLNEILNLNKPMSEEQMKLASTLICEEFYMLKMADLTLLFKRIISGQYGEFYERLSIDKVLPFFRNYLEERFEIAIDQSSRAHRDLKQDEFI